MRDARGNPVAGRINMFQAALSNELSPMVMTGPDGTFELTDLPPGQVSICAQGIDLEARTTLTGQAGDELSWDAYLGPSDGVSWRD